MKNIHVLPTNKPSRLYYWEDKLVLGNLATTPINRNIYITNDEEIKEMDWFYNTSTERIAEPVQRRFMLTQLNENCKKIVLTDHPTLIENGVQAIDDEFLEWFVKNPSCEFVEVVSAKTIPALQLTGNGHCWWKIIIPKEEPKQGTINPADFMQLGEKAFEENVHEKLRETLSPNEKQMWINGYLLALTQQNKK